MKHPITTLKKFNHDGSEFEIRANPVDGVWQVMAICDGNQIGNIATVSEQVRSDAIKQNLDPLEVIADEFEGVIISIRDFTIKSRAL